MRDHCASPPSCGCTASFTGIRQRRAEEEGRALSISVVAGFDAKGVRVWFTPSAYSATCASVAAAEDDCIRLPLWCSSHSPALLFHPPRAVSLPPPPPPLSAEVTKRGTAYIYIYIYIYIYRKKRRGSLCLLKVFLPCIPIVRFSHIFFKQIRAKGQTAEVRPTDTRTEAHRRAGSVISLSTTFAANEEASRFPQSFSARSFLREELAMFCRLGSKLLSPAMLNAQYASTGSNIKNTGTRAQTWLQVSLPVGSNLAEIIPTFLQPFGAMQVNVSNVLNNLHTLEGPAAHPGVFLDVDLHELDSRMPELLARLRTLSPNVSIIGSWCTVWYPTKPTDLDLLDQTTLAAGEELQDDPENPHPGFHDEVYRARRREVVSFAKDFKTGDAIPIIDYTEDERSVWRTVFDMLSELFPTNACHEFNQVLPRMIEGGVMSRMQVPQLAAVNDFLSEATGFTVRPVAGLLTSRDFLNALAFRVFFSTQYIRHHAQPLYTPEPDMVHDILGHTPLLADPDFAAFTQSIGFASLGASDQLIEELARVYWYSVEFGLCKESGGIRAYGAGVLSSPGELRRALGPEPERVPFDPFVAAKLPFPMTRYQPKYFVAGSFKEAQHLMEKWLEGWGKPFRVQYDSCTKTVQALPL